MKKINYKPLVLSELTPKDIGKPVHVRQKWDMEYGIITDYTDRHVFVHMNRGQEPLMLTANAIFIPTVTKPFKL